MEIYINKIKSPIAHFHFDFFFFLKQMPKVT